MLTFSCSDSWPLDIASARDLQQKLAADVSLQGNLDFEKIQYVAGTDIGLKDNGKICHAAIAVLSFPELSLVEYVTAETPSRFPYIPGYLSFRELPVLLQAIEKLKLTPDVFLCDGQGIAHPRRLGIASHLGVLLNHPCIGVAKNILVGRHAPLHTIKGHCVELLDKGEQIGWALRSRTDVKPIYISPGHRVSFASTLELTKACLTRYRLPETTRWADKIASRKIDLSTLEVNNSTEKLI